MTRAPHRPLRPHALLLVLALALAPAPAAHGQTPPLPCPTIQGFHERCEDWVATYDDPAIESDSYQFAAGMAPAPDGETIYLAIKSVRGGGWESNSTWLVLAVDAEDGEVRWEARFGDPADYSFPAAVAASPDGSLVHVVGSTRPTFSDPDSQLRTISYDASTGDEVWTASYDGPGAGTDNGMGIESAPDGSAVYVAAVSDSDPNGVDLDYAILAYDAATGEERWATRYAGPKKGGVDSPRDLAVDPSGERVYVTGWSAGLEEFDLDYATIAVHARGEESGEIAWEARYDGTGHHNPDQAHAVEVAPDGSAVLVTGMSNNVPHGPPFGVNYEFATLAYDAATGDRRWEARRGWEGTSFNVATQLAVAGDGVVVTGQSSGDGHTEMLTVAHDIETGGERWSERFGAPQHDFNLPLGLAATSDGADVFVTGVSSASETSTLLLGQGQLGDQVTLAYDSATGARRWVARLNTTRYGFDKGVGAVVHPNDERLYVLGELTRNIELDRNFYDVALTAYPLGE